MFSSFHNPSSAWCAVYSFDCHFRRSHPGADGRAECCACCTMDKLRPILQEIRKTFPDSPHTNMYARFGDIYKRYSVDDLKEMKELNVKFLYMGMESGSDKVLADIKKGVTQEEMLEAGARIREAGIPFNGRFELPTYRDILREERKLLENIGQDYPLEVWTGGFLPGERFIVGNFPEDRDRILKQISERRITNRMLDQKLMVAGGL